MPVYMSEVSQLETLFHSRAPNKTSVEEVRNHLRRQIAHDLEIPDDDDGIWRVPSDTRLSRRATIIFNEYKHELGQL